MSCYIAAIIRYTRAPILPFISGVPTNDWFIPVKISLILVTVRLQSPPRVIDHVPVVRFTDCRLQSMFTGLLPMCAMGTLCEENGPDQGSYKIPNWVWKVHNITLSWSQWVHSKICDSASWFLISRINGPWRIQRNYWFAILTFSSPSTSMVEIQP
jgi:hypothetical protein